jgi:hypothetical protein
MAKFDRHFLAHKSSFRQQRSLKLSGVERLWRWTGELKAGFPPAPHIEEEEEER